MGGKVPRLSTLRSGADSLDMSTSVPPAHHYINPYTPNTTSTLPHPAADPPSTSTGMVCTSALHVASHSRADIPQSPPPCLHPEISSSRVHNCPSHHSTAHLRSGDRLGQNEGCPFLFQGLAGAAGCGVRGLMGAPWKDGRMLGYTGAIPTGPYMGGPAALPGRTGPTRTPPDASIPGPRAVVPDGASECTGG